MHCDRSARPLSGSRTVANPVNRLSLVAWGAALALLVLIGVTALAADPPAKSDTQDKKEPAAAGESVKPPREQTIYIPYNKLREVFEKQGRGVFLPYEQFQQLWEAARRGSASPVDPKPPVGVLITDMESEAVASKEVMRVKAKLRIDVMTAGWHQVPLRLADAAITTATIDGQPARVVGSPEKGYQLWLQNKDGKPQQVQFTLEYAKAITKNPGQNAVSFAPPESAVSRWQIKIPEPGVKVVVQPMLAATEQPAGTRAADETVISAFVGGAPQVTIQWTPKAEGAAGMEALTSVQSEQQVDVTEGAVRARTRLIYSISRAELSQISIEVPADHKVVNVFDPNIRQWTVKAADKSQIIVAQLFEPAKGSQQVTVELEKFFELKEKQSLTVPVVKAVNVGRQQGLVAVSVAEGLRAEASRAVGLVQVDSGELPAALAQRKAAFAYRFAAVPFELTLAVEKVRPRLLADALLEAYVEPQRLTIDWSVLLTVERAGVFRVEAELPKGLEVVQVRGRELPGAPAVQVEGHHLEGADKRTLVVDLARKALGKVGLRVTLRRELREPALVTPGEKDVEIAFDIPRLRGMEQSTGRILVYGPESLRLNAGKLEGLRTISFKEALEPLPSGRDGMLASLRPVLAFAHTQESASLGLLAQRRKPQVTVAQMLLVRIEDGVVKYQATFNYDVLYSGIKSLRIDIPKAVAGRLTNTTPNIREKEISPPPRDLPEGYVAWAFAGESELFGKGGIHLTWEDEANLAKLEIGKSVEIAVPRLRPAAVDRAWGQIVLTKAETIDVEPGEKSEGIRPIDPQHDLMPGHAAAGAARAFEFHDDWRLPITATRYRLEEVKRTSIERALVRMVVTPAEQMSVQALYHLRSVGQRLEIKLPPGARFDTQPLRIDGKPVGLEQGQADQFFIPLTNTSAEATVLMELRYNLAQRGGRFQLPQFPHEPAVQKTFLCVYLPDEWLLMGKKGPWTTDFQWWLDKPFNNSPNPTNESELLAWLIGGRQLGDNHPAKTFPVDGQLHVFSALQPPPSPEGDLQLATIHRTSLTSLVLGALVVFGLALLALPWRVRFIGLAVLGVAVVLLGLFAPIAAWQLLTKKFLFALLVVIGLWLLASLVALRPRGPRPGASPSAPVAPAAPSEPPPEPVAPVPPADKAEGGLSHE